MTPEKKPKNRRNTEFWRAAKYLFPYRRLVALSLICAFLAGTIMTSGIATIIPVIQVLIKGQTLQESVRQTIAGRVSGGEPTPWYLNLAQQAVDQLPTNRVQTVAVILALIAAVAIVGNVIRYFYEYNSDKCAILAVNDVRASLYDHALHLPLGFFGLKGTSDITSRLVQECQILQDGFKILLGQTVIEMIRAVLALALALVVDWRLTIFIICFAPISLTVMRKFGKRMRRASRAALQNNASMLGQVEASLSGIRVVKAANAERFERRRYLKIMEFLKSEQLKLAHYEALSTPVLETMGLILLGSVVIFATYLMWGEDISHRLTDARFFMVMLALVQIGEALRRVSKVNAVMQRSNAAASRVFETLDIPIERPRHVDARRASAAVEGEHLINLPEIQREVRFEAVTFAYPGTSQPALNDVDLVVPRGKSIAIVGRNGSGKTTLAALLPRFYDPDQGRVTIDGIDIRHATLRSLRRQIGIVTQDSVIFPGSVAENIAYGLPRVSREQIVDAAKQAFAHDFIMEKPQGYDAPLEGLGGQLSGGQKQRLNIARAILRQSPILILDEATSQVDAESEALIQQAIERLMHQRTTFVIAHRLNTIVSADSIVVMDRGRIVGQGRHEELLRTCDTYRQLYERQMFQSPSEDAA
jgi:ABC-type multidrug transport system fused ATPase/permease subunit